MSRQFKVAWFSIERALPKPAQLPISARQSHSETLSEARLLAAATEIFRAPLTFDLAATLPPRISRRRRFPSEYTTAAKWICDQSGSVRAADEPASAGGNSRRSSSASSITSGIGQLETRHGRAAHVFADRRFAEPRRLADQPPPHSERVHQTQRLRYPRLGNTPVIYQRCYVHPEVLNS
jgi:hypothetical protein